MTTPNEELMKLADAYAAVTAGAVPDSDRYKIGLRTQEARAALHDALQSQTERIAELEQELKTAQEGWKCECSTDDACRFARERDTLREQLEQIAATEPVGAIYTIAGVQHCTITKNTEDTDLFTRPMPAQDVTELVEALEWIANVNAMDYEYQRTAKAALSKYKGAK